MALPLSLCLFCNMVYLVTRQVLLIEFLPSDMALLATCVSADRADGNPTLERRLCGRTTIGQ